MTIHDKSSPFSEPGDSRQDDRSSEHFPETNELRHGTTSLRPEAISLDHGTPSGLEANADRNNPVIESLNIKIDDVISDRSLIRAEPLTPLPELALMSPPQDTTMNDRDGDQLTGWLARVPDEQSDTRSFAGGAAMCIGVMLLSTLAGYGTAQLINRSIASTDSAKAELPTKVTVASNAQVMPAWPSTNEFKSAKETPASPTVAAAIQRVRVEPTAPVDSGVAAGSGGETIADAATIEAPAIEPKIAANKEVANPVESEASGKITTNAALSFAASTTPPDASDPVKTANAAAPSSVAEVPDAADETLAKAADVENELEPLEIAAARAIKAAEPQTETKREPDVALAFENTFETAVIAADATESGSASTAPEVESSKTPSLDVSNFSVPDFDDIAPQPEHVETAAVEPDPKPAATRTGSTPEAAPETTEAPVVSDPQTKHLFRRAEQFIEEGDIAAARLMLRHLAEAGNGPAAFKLAQAYDPDWLAENGTDTVPPNRDLAVRWYTMAHDRGQDGAAERLKALEAGQ